MVKDVEKGQPEVNIGLVGHVDHGKTTLTEKLSGKWTDTHSEEMRRGITIRLGYADAVFREIPGKEDPDRWTTAKEVDGVKTVPVRKVSFLDAPGHESLMATMLSGAAIMDGALLLVAANEECPQPQTREHLMALQIVGIKNVVVIQNKVDLVSPERAKENYKEIKNFLKGTGFDDLPIIPVSAQHGVNIDVVISAIQKYIPTPKREGKAEPIMFVARSFDINKPGDKIDDLQGGVLGGSLGAGVLKEGDDIEIRPGRVYEEMNQRVCKPITTKVSSIMTGGKKVKEVGPGGSIGLLTTLDPSIVKSDSLSGNVVGHPGKLPPVWDDFELETKLLERVVGSREDMMVEPIKMGEKLLLNVNSSATVGIVTKLGKDKVHVKLLLPVCAKAESRVTISRRVGTRFRLIGYGILKE